MRLAVTTGFDGTLQLRAVTGPGGNLLIIFISGHVTFGATVIETHHGVDRLRDTVTVTCTEQYEIPN